METSLVIYTYAKCSTCRDAIRWLNAHKIVFEERPIRETPPTLTELRAMLALHDGDMRKLFNTSGIDYRAQNLALKLPTLSEGDALALLRTNGNLVKRPFVLTKDGLHGAVGFKPEMWEKIFLS